MLQNRDAGLIVEIERLRIQNTGMRSRSWIYCIGEPDLTIAYCAKGVDVTYPQDMQRLPPPESQRRLS
jgi:hypothetical protein